MGLFVDGVVEEVAEGLEDEEHVGYAVGPRRVEEEALVAGVELAVVGHAEIEFLCVATRPAFGGGLEHVAAPSGIGPEHLRGVDNLLPLLDVVYNGVAQFVEDGTIDAPQAPINAGMALGEGRHLEVTAGALALPAEGAEGGGEEGLVGRLVVGEADVAVNAVGGSAGCLGGHRGLPEGHAADYAVDVFGPEGSEFVVFGAVGLKPGAVVVGREAAQEIVEAADVMHQVTLYPPTRRRLCVPRRGRWSRRPTRRRCRRCGR